MLKLPALRAIPFSIAIMMVVLPPMAGAQAQRGMVAGVVIDQVSRAPVEAVRIQVRRRLQLRARLFDLVLHAKPVEQVALSGVMRASDFDEAASEHLSSGPDPAFRLGNRK